MFRMAKYNRKVSTLFKGLSSSSIRKLSRPWSDLEDGDGDDSYDKAATGDGDGDGDSDGDGLTSTYLDSRRSRLFLTAYGRLEKASPSAWTRDTEMTMPKRQHRNSNID